MKNKIIDILFIIGLSLLSLSVVIMTIFVIVLICISL